VVKEGRILQDNPSIVSRQTILALSEGKTNKANEYLENYISIRKENSASETAITTSLGYIYEDAGIMDKVEIYYRETLSLEVDNRV
jgi:Tfp pilus assembly protein PilF